MFSSLSFTCMLHGAAGSLNLTWMLQFRKLRIAWTLLGCCNSRCCGLLLFEVELSYIFIFCTFTTSSFANVGLGFVFHIHFQSSNMYILRFLHFEIHWDLVPFFFFVLLESTFEISCWNLYVVLEFFVEVEFQIQNILKVWFKMS
jgi:hypothetical protein